MSQPSFVQRLDARWTAAILAVILTAFAIHKPAPFNYDFLVYYHAAKAYLAQGWHAAMAVYPWPFYSVFIAFVSKFTHLDLLTSAYTLSLFSFALISFCFIALLRELGATRTVQWIGMIVVLFTPLINTFRLMLIRDPGYWGFYLLSLLFFIRYFHSLKWRYSFAWAISMLVAMLFRIEAAVFLCLVPLLLLLRAQTGIIQRCRYVVKAYTLPVLLGLIVLAGMFFLSMRGANHLGRLQQFINQAHSGLFQFYQSFQDHCALLLKSGVLNIWSVEYVHVFMAGSLIFFYCYMIFMTINVFYFILIIYGICQGVIRDERGTACVLWGFIIINMVLTAVFLGQNFFLSNRYIFPIALTAFLWVPFAVERLYNNWRSGIAYRWTGLILAGLVILFSAYIIGGCTYYFLKDKGSYLKAAGQWAQHTVPAQATVYTNEPRLLIYMHRSEAFSPYQLNFTSAELTKNYQMTWSHYDVLLIDIVHDVEAKQQLLTQAIGQAPIKVFRHKDREVVIYNLKSKSVDTGNPAS